MAKASVLLVEDNTFQALETKNYPENSGYDVIVAGNGK
jgi:CheY-like chemotaxis protein